MLEGQTDAVIGFGSERERDCDRRGVVGEQDCLRLAVCGREGVAQEELGTEAGVWKRWRRWFKVRC